MPKPKKVTREYRGVDSPEAKRQRAAKTKLNRGVLLKLVPNPLNKKTAARVAKGTIPDPRLAGKKSTRVREHKWVRA